MDDKYSSDLTRVAVAEIAKAVGYDSTQSAPLDLLQDIMQRYIQSIGRNLHRQAQHANRSTPNLKDVALSLKLMNTNASELKDYVENVPPIPLDKEIPAYPIKKESHLNFLNPRSGEAVMRPEHIFKYLPPMHPEGKYDNINTSVAIPTLDSLNRNRKNDDSSRSLGQSENVGMTESGVIWSKVEGKLPVSYVPEIAIKEQPKIAIKKQPKIAMKRKRKK